MADESDKNDGNERSAAQHQGQSTANPSQDAAASKGSIAAGLVHLIMKDGSLAGLGREALKDIQSTYSEVAWGHSGHGSEPGAPLSPLASDVEEAREYHAERSIQLPSPGDIAKGLFTAVNGGQGNGQGQTQANTGQGNVQGQTQADGVQGTVHGQSQADSRGDGRDLPSPGDIARGNFTAASIDQGNVHDPAQANDRGGQQMAQLGPWTQREIEREIDRNSGGGGGGQNEPFVARILPDEQREQQKEQDRGRGR